MDFRQIEAFVQVYRLRNFSRAGDVLFLTQPTISSHISLLENELGEKLFDRSSRDVLPTGAGDIFYQYAINLLETRNTATASLKEYSRKIEGRLEITASTIPSQYLLPAWIKGFCGQYPDICFSVHECSTREAIRAIQDKKYQLGIVGTRMDEDKLDYELLSGDKLVLISARGNNALNAVASGIALDNLLAQNFIVREPGSATRQEFETALKKKRINPDRLHIVAEMNSTEAIKHAVREGLGVAVVSSLSVRDYLDLDLIDAYIIAGLELDRSFYLATHRNQPLSPNVSAFREYVLRQRA